MKRMLTRCAWLFVGVLALHINLSAQKVHRVPNAVADTLYLESFIEDISKWSPGDIIMLIDNEYWLNGTVDIFQEVTIMGDPGLDKRPLIHFYDNGFRAKEDSIAITLKGMVMDGYDPNDQKNAPYVMRYDQASWFNEYDLVIEDVEAYDFNGGIQLYKNQRKHYNSVTLDNVYFHDMLGDFVLDPRLNWVEQTTIKNSTFSNVKGFIKNYYNDNDGANEWGVKTSSVLIENNTFYNAASDVFIQQNDGKDGSLAFEFNNNIVSGLIDHVNSRPFRIDPAVGDVTFTNNVFHDFDSERETPAYNYETAVAQDNVTATGTTTDDPKFSNPGNGTFYTTVDLGDSEWFQTAASVKDLEAFIENTDLWTAGDPIILSEPEYWIHGTVDIFQSIHVEGADANNPPLLHFYDNGFRAKEDTISITLKNLILDGYDPNDGKTANHALRFDQANWYNEYEITLENVEVYDFNGGIQLYKNQKKHVKSLTIDNCYFHDLYGDYVLDPRLNWVENTTITNSTFANVKGFIKNYYNNNEGANDDKFGTQTSTVLVDHNTFYNAASDAFIQQNDGKDGSLDFTFSNNIVSGLLDTENSRPFRIDPLVGTVNLSNSVFHDFETSRVGGYNLDTASLQTNVVVTAVTEDDPKYTDAGNGNFTPKSFAIYTGDDQGGAQGDPKWIGTTVAQDIDLEAFIENTDLWTAGDPIILSEPEYWIHGTVDIFQSIHVEGADANNPPLLHFYDNGFRAKEDTISITLKNLILDGYDPNDGKTANHALRFDQANWYNEYEITLENVEVYDFNGGIQLYKNQKKHVKSLTIDNCYFHDLYGDYVLDPRLNWVENTTITNSTFANVKGFIKNYYNNNEGANDDKFGTQTSTVLVDHNTFYNAASDAFIQQNDGKDGSLDFTFSNNIVSGLLDTENSRPFRIDPLVGTVNLSNSVFHDFETSRVGGYNLDTASLQTNVVVTAVTEDDPKYTDAGNGNFTPKSFAIYTGDDQGGAQGDPKWIGTTVAQDIDLEAFIENTDLWTAGDPIILSEPEYWIHGTVDIFQSIHVEGADANNPPLLHFYDNGFRAKEDTISITLKNLILDGYDPNDGKTANHALRFDQANWYNEYEITLENVEVYDFNGGIQLYKNQKKHVKSLTIDNCYFHDLYGDYVLDPRLNWVENTTITNSTFANVKGFIKNYYNNNEGANDDKFGTQTSTVLVDHNTFYNAASDAFIQQNDGKDGSLDFTFSNNIVSGLLDTENSRPFRIDPLVGDVTLSNNVFHDIESDRDTPAYNYETAAGQANVTSTANTTDDPMFVAAPLNLNFGDAGLLVAGSDAGQIGDPDWTLSLESVVTILPVTDDVIEGDVVQLEAATNQTIIWSVMSDGGEAMIDEMTGELVALEKGMVVVTATSKEDSNLSDQVTIDIEERIIPVESIKLFATPDTINSAGTARIIAKILPIDATDRTVMWSSSDETIGSFGDEFVSVIEFDAALAGTVRLYGSAMGAEGLVDSVDLVVEQAVTSVDVTAAADIVNAGDYTLQFTATVGPEDAVEPAVSWSVNVPDTVATIDETGLLTAIDTASSVVVTATSVDGSEISGSYEVAIVRPVGSIVVSSAGGATSINSGETLQMSAEVGPEDAYNKEYTWAVSSTTVATIDENGLLTGKKGGVVAVTAIASDGSETRGTLNIEVIQPLGITPVDDLATIYPNPSSDFINITVDGVATIQIITLTGQKVMTRELAGEDKIEIRTLPAGVYVLKVSTGTEVQTINFVKY